MDAIASDQADPIEATMVCTKKFLDYAATHRDAIISYHASNIVLAVHSDASYLSESKARSQAGGHFFCQVIPMTPRTMGQYLMSLTL